MTFANVVSLLGLSQGVLLGAVIVLAHRRDRPTYLLGLFILTLALRVIPFLLLRTPYGVAQPSVLFLPLYFWLPCIPLVYLYVRDLAGVLVWRKDGIHLLPGLIEFLGLGSLYVIDVSKEGPLFPPEVQRGIIGTCTIVAIVPAAYYMYRTLHFLRGHRDYLLSYYSNLTDRDLLWIRNAFFAMIGFALLYTLLVYGPLPAAPEIRIPFGAIGNTAIIYYVAFHGIRQLGVKPQLSDPEPEPGTDHEQAFREVEEYMQNSKIYLDPNLTLGDLGKHVRQSERNLSRIVNAGSGQHFNAYVNRYRIAAAQQMLVNPDYDRYTMAGIANEAGFNTKATFYQAFKRENAVSPAVYRRQRGGPTAAE